MEGNIDIGSADCYCYSHSHSGVVLLIDEDHKHRLEFEMMDLVVDMGIVDIDNVSNHP